MTSEAVSTWASTPAVAGQIVTAQIADNAVITTKINAKAVTTAKIDDLAVGNGQLGAGAVTNTKLGILTDTTKFEMDVETNPWNWEKGNGTVIGSVSWDAGQNALVYGSNTKTIWNAPFNHAGPIGQLITSATANLTLSTHHTILANATSGAFTVTLPAATGIDGRIYVIKKTDSSVNTVTIDGNASETIDGATTKVLTTQYQAVTIQCDGTGWHIIEAYL